MSTKKRLVIISLLLMIAGFIAFWQVTRCEFINFDDPKFVSDNRHVQGGLTVEGITWAFTTGQAANWHPLTWISHMIDVQLFGLQPRWHHLTNLLFHLASTLLLFLVLHRMTKALWQSAFVAALFALHPLHVESVAWVAERKDVLSTFFWMLTMGIYVSYAARPGLARYLTLLLCFALGLMAKPMLVTLPFVLLLLDYWPLQRLEQKPLLQPGGHWRSIRPLLTEKIPLFVLAALSSIVTYLVQQHAGAMKALEALPLGARTANAFVSYITYMVKMLWPANLAVFYPHPASWPLWQVLGSAMLLTAITVIVIRGARKRPYAAVGWLWYVGTLVPVIGIVQVGSQAMADRYTYIPLIGLFIIVAWAVPELLDKWSYRRQALVALSTLCLLCLFLLTWRQVGYWRTSIALYDHTLEVAGASSVIHNNRGLAYIGLADYPRAIADFERAIEIDSRYAGAYNNRGLAYNGLADYARAIADFERAVEIDPGYAGAYNNRGLASIGLADYPRAIGDFNRAIEIDPSYGEAYNNRGVAYGSLGNHTRAIADFNRAIEIDPGYAGAYYNRGVAYSSLGNRKHVIDDIRTAARLGHKGARSFLKSQGISW
jgi:Tfp pilus assembly protein PilF